jgi:cytochrome P450
VSAPTVPSHVPSELVRDFDHITDQDFLQDPFGNAQRYRADRAFWSPHWNGYWVLTQGQDIRAAYQSPTLFSAHPGGLPPRPGGPIMIPEEMDPPEHTKYRRAISGMFSPRRVNLLQQDIQRLASELVQTVAPSGHVEFVTDFGAPLPTRIFIGQLGLPLSEALHFVDWNNVLLHALDESKLTASQEIGIYLHDLVKHRKAHLGDDWISELIQSRVDDRPLTDDEVVGMTFLLFLAGLETVTAGLTFGINFLARNAVQRRRIVEHPATIPNAVEELLRYQSFASTSRRVTTDIEFAGVQMRAGDRVLLFNTMASRDPVEVDRPQEFDLDRPAIRHFAFGAGAHRCVGSHLARLEMGIALAAWHERIPEYRIDTERRLPMWGGTNMAIKSLEVDWDPTIGAETA